MSDPQPIRYLPANLADQIRRDCREIRGDQLWKITRLVERAYGEGYDTAYMRGYHDGYDRGRADEANAIEDEQS